MGRYLSLIRFVSEMRPAASTAVVASVLVLAIVSGPAVTAAPAEEPDRVFRAGAAMSNVPPPLGTSINGGMQDRSAAHVHDELNARALVMDDGEKLLAMVVVDNCMIPREDYDEAKRLDRERNDYTVGIILKTVLQTNLSR